MTIPAVYKFQNWITGTPVPIDDAITSALTSPVDSALSAALSSIASGFVYNAVTQGGADNTGATNAYAALNASAAAAVVAGKWLYLPSGTYDITGNTWRIPSNLNVFGDGPFRTILKRTTDTNIGTVEVYNATHVRISGIGILYTPLTYTLGYAQAGWAVRDGSIDVEISDCSIQGVMNRGFHVINSAAVRILKNYAIGCGDACMRVVSDFAANLVAGFADETSPIVVREIIVQNNIFTGATTLVGSTRANTFYGINCAGVLAANGDLIEEIIVSNNIVRYTNLQGISFSGSMLKVACIGNTVNQIRDGGTNGVGILWQILTDIPSFGALNGNVCTNCYNSMYILGSTAVVVTGNQCSNGFNYGILLNAASYCTIMGNICISDSSHGIYVTGASTYLSITANSLVGNGGWGILTDGATDHILFGDNISVANTSGADSIAGTNHKQSNNTWP